MKNDRELEEARIRSAIDRRAKALRAGDGRTDRHAQIACKVHDLSITTGEGAACGHGVIQISGCKADGHRIDTWVPATFCLRKIDGAWQVTNARTPLPFQ